MILPSRSTARSLTLWGFSALPLVCLIILLGFYSLDMPVSDDWDFVPLLQKQAQHTLTLQDLWEPYAEHRMIAGRVVMLALAEATHWNLYYQYGLNLVCSVGILAAVGTLLRRYLKQTEAGVTWNYLLPASSVILLSANGWLNYFWGYTFHSLLSVCATAWGIALLVPLTARRFVISIACGLIASFSFGNGILYWPLAVFILLASPMKARIKAIAAFGLIMAGIATGWLAVRGVEMQSGMLARLAANASTFVLYVLNFLGTPLGPPGHSISVVLGGLGLLLFLILAACTLRKQNPVLIQFIALGLYSVLSACSIGLGRMHFGALQASDQRYYLVACLLWPSLIVLLDYVRRGSSGKMTWAVNAGIVLIISLSCLRSIPQLRNIRIYSQHQFAAQAALMNGRDDNALEYWSTARVSVPEIKSRDLVLRQLGLSFHRNNSKALSD